MIPYPFARLLGAATLLLFLLVPPHASAQSPGEITLADALASGSAYAAGVVSARNDLASARRDLELAQADPATTPLSLRASQRAVAAAEDALGVALRVAAGDVVSAYAAVLEASATRAASAQQLAILETTFSATEARFEAGAVTAAELAKAESEVATQRRTLQEADTNLDFARDSLAALLGTAADALTPITSTDLLGDASADDVLRRALEGNARLTAARRGLAAAREQLAAVDNVLSSRAEVDAARKAVANAEAALADLEAAVMRDVQRAVASVTSARNRYQGAQEATRAAAAALAAQEARLQAGTISEITHAQSVLALANAEASEAGALHALLAAQYALELAAAR